MNIAASSSNYWGPSTLAKNQPFKIISQLISGIHRFIHYIYRKCAEFENICHIVVTITKL